MPGFDFSNYTYSGLLSILATLFGMAYPLIIDCISKIDDKYDSTILMARFLKETRYRIFIMLLAVNVAVGLGMPFVLSLFAKNNNDELLLVQTILMVALIAQTFVLIRLILTYYNANSLCVHLELKQTKNWTKVNSNIPYVRALFDVARYAAKKSDRQLYVKSASSLYSAIYILQEKTNSKQDSNNVPEIVEYPLEIKEILSDYCDFVRYNKNVYPFVRNEVDVLSSMVSSIQPCIFGDWEYSYIWRNVYYAAQDGDEEWFIHKYWVWMDQYYRFQIESKSWSHKASGKYVADRFRLNVSMACAMMLRMKHYKIVNDAVFFSQSTYNPYPLVPNTYGQIFEQGRMLYELRFGIMNASRMSACFMMPEIYSGIGSDGIIYKEGVKYLALMMIRLYSVNNYNFTFSDPLSLPTYRRKINELEADIQLAEDLRISINGWFANNVFNLFPSFTRCKQTEVNGMLWKYKNECDRIIKLREKDFTPSDIKLQAFLSHLKELEGRLAGFLPQFNDCILDEEKRIDKSISSSIKASIPMSCMTEWKDMDLETIPDHSLEYVKHEIENKYINILNESSNLNFTSTKKEVFFKKLKKEWLSLDYICIATGNAITEISSTIKINKLENDGCTYNYKGLRIIELEEGDTCAFILKRVDLPYVTFKPVSGFQQWGSLGVIYSNIEGLNHNTLPEYSLLTKIDISISRKVEKVTAEAFKF